MQAPATKSTAPPSSGCRQHTDIVETENGWLLAVAQQERDGSLVDTEDRVQKAASFLQDSSLQAVT